MIRGLTGAMFERKRGGWVNPYITNGLVAMWDGEWNAGGGVHDGAATVWKDLSGNNFDVPISDGNLWGDDHLVTSVSNEGADTIRDIGTIEVVYRKDSVAACGVLAAGPGRYLYISGSKIIGIGSAAYKRPYIGNVYDSTKYSLSVTYDSPTSGITGNVVSFFRNGVESLEESGSDYWNCRTKVTLGGGYDNKGRSLGGIIWAVRIYKSILTNEQRLHNYAVDKARFNLA